MTNLTGPLPRPCCICVVGGARWGKHCPLRDAVRADTGHDICCRVCLAEPSLTVTLMSDRADRWYCLAHSPEGEGESA
jgi:hypothetical protein